MKTAFITANGHIKAAWCNDQHLVVISEGLPARDTSAALAEVPFPPLGGPACRVRSAAKKLLAFKVRRASLLKKMLRPACGGESAGCGSAFCNGRSRINSLGLDCLSTASGHTLAGQNMTGRRFTSGGGRVENTLGKGRAEGGEAVPHRYGWNAGMKRGFWA